MTRALLNSLIDRVWHLTGSRVEPQTRSRPGMKARPSGAFFWDRICQGSQRGSDQVAEIVREKSLMPTGNCGSRQSSGYGTL
jgi:hypothetical protein